MDHHELLIDPSPVQDLLATDDGHPVWPVRTAAELNALQQIVSLFGASFREVKGYPTSATHGTEVVVALEGSLTSEVAELYAHLTRRRWVQIAGVDDLETYAGRVAVVVANLERLDNRLLSILYSRPVNNQCPGLVFAEPAMLRQQALVRAAAASLEGRVEISRAYVLPVYGTPRVQIEDQKLKNSRRMRDAVLSAIGCGAGVLAVQTHSDGVDGMLSPGLTLCGMDHPPSDADLTLSNGCTQSGFCHRARTDVSAFVRSSKFISPDAFRARVLVWDVCWGVMPPVGLIDQAWGIGARFFNSPTLGAILTTWDLAFVSESMLRRLVVWLEDGMTVGQAIARHNASPEAQALGHRLCLLGDPRVRLRRNKPLAPDIARTRSKRATPPRAFFSKDPGSRFLETLIHGMMSTTGVSLGGTDKLALRAIRDSVATTGSALKRDQVAAGQLLRTRILDCVRKRGPTIMSEWVNQAILKPVTDTPLRCFACGDPSNDLLISLAYLPSCNLVRRLSRCQRCGVVEDVPSTSDLTFSVGADTCVRIQGTLPQDAWTARLIVRLQKSRRRMCWKWPADRNGYPARVFRIPIDRPSGILQAGFALVYRTDLFVLTQFIQGEKSQSSKQMPIPTS